MLKYKYNTMREQKIYIKMILIHSSYKNYHCNNMIVFDYEQHDKKFKFAIYVDIV
jgi:hypothetical protein